MICEMFALLVVVLVHLCVEILAGPPGTPFDKPLDIPLAASMVPPPRDACSELADRYSERYRFELEHHGRAFRPLALRGRSARLVVRGAGVAGGARAAAAALLRTVLRAGLGYDAVADSRAFDICAAVFTQLSVAPAARSADCRDGGVARTRLSGGAGSVLLSTVLRARSVNSSAFLSLHQLKTMSSTLPFCAVSERTCVPGDEQRRVVLAASTDSTALANLQTYICNNNLSLAVLQFNDTSCFDDTIKYLLQANLSFLFLDDDLKIKATDLFQMNLSGDTMGGSCLAHSLNEATDLSIRIGDGTHMRRYAPQIADVVERFCPSLTDLEEIATNQSENHFDMDIASCKWALRNNQTFATWIAKKKQEYGLYVYICTNDRFNNEYIETMEVIQSVVEHDYGFHVYKVYVECHDRHNMTEVFLKIIQEDEKRTVHLMGIVAWSSSEGVVDMARIANQKQVPLALAGPVAPEVPQGPVVVAPGGSLHDLTAAYRIFFNTCGWTRLAILSDNSSYSKSFTNSLVQEDTYIYSERIVTIETIGSILKSLQHDQARIIIVNTKSSLATEIMEFAVRLDMSPPLYTWIVREWTPDNGSVVAEWSIFSLGIARQGGDAGHTSGWVSESEDGAGGHAKALQRLQALWPSGPWLALVAPLADAILSLHSSFSVFEHLYSSDPHRMRHGGYAMSISQILDKMGSPGVGWTLSFCNGTAAANTPYLERWRGVCAERVELSRGGAGAWCGARDRPACSFPAGGRAFKRRCYDVQMYSLLVALALIPVVFAAARRARLRRLRVRDLNLLAQISEGERLSPVVHGDLLCIHKKIGTGNYGDVYLATLRQAREKRMLVAAKALRDDSGKEEYLLEAGTLQLLDHENIVKFVGICVWHGSLLILMEYAQHGDLLGYLRSRRRLVVGADVTNAVEEREAEHVRAESLSRLAREAARALVYLAQRGLVHRDVRAANCLIDERRSLKLADFGLARRVCDNREYTSVRRAVFPVLWMAPESLTHGTFSSASDVWSLGVLCLELATLGARPYGDSAPHQVLVYVRQGGRPPLPPDASPHTVALVMACWRQEASQRVTAAEVERFLTRQPRAICPALQPAPDWLPQPPVSAPP